ncbi:hypothetical protein AbraIFM66950_007349 [Aspergillus brasiliensis]|nr:hypothetical protein AbraIFM66950_007349 [Aspergillus brasiliensis]
MEVWIVHWKPWSFYLIFLPLLLMVFLVSLDTISLDATTRFKGDLTSSSKAITSEFSGTTLTRFWASISFILAVVVLQPMYTGAPDIIGQKIPVYAALFSSLSDLSSSL